MEKTVDLRGHHLITLASLHATHKLPCRPLIREARAVRLAIQGYKEAESFNDHLMRVVDEILEDKVYGVRIVDEHDEVCKGCKQGREDHCIVNNKSWSANFLEMADRAIIENTGGVLELGQVYSPQYLITNMQAIRLAILKTAPQIPGLLRLA